MPWIWLGWSSSWAIGCQFARFLCASTCMWLMMFLGKIWFFMTIISVWSQNDDSWGHMYNDSTIEEKTVVFKGLYCDPKPILCHCKIVGETILHLFSRKSIFWLTSLSEWPTGLLFWVLSHGKLFLYLERNLFLASTHIVGEWAKRHII